jgi:hypothetical protein
MSDTTVILNDDEMGALLQALSHWVLVTRGMTSSTDCAIPAGFFRHQTATLEGIVAKLPETERAYFAEITPVGGPTEDQLIETAIELEILHVQKEQPCRLLHLAADRRVRRERCHRTERALPARHEASAVFARRLHRC